VAETVTTNVQVTPTVTLSSNDEAGAKYIAAALVKSAEFQAAGTQALASALGAAGRPPAEKKSTSNPANLALWGLIAYLILKGI